MFCLEHFSPKCIIKDIELKVNDPLKAQNESYHTTYAVKTVVVDMRDIPYLDFLTLPSPW